MATETTRDPQLRIVLDSNIWIGKSMLLDTAGSAVRFFLRKNNAVVVLPEVVRREVEYNLETHLLSTTKRIRSDHRQLLSLLGSMKELVLPSDEELRTVARAAFSKISIDVVDLPFSMESAHSSLDKCIRSEPPSGEKNQQFKDGVVWADCLGLADRSDVLLITEDRGFYRNRNYAQGLSPNLLEEARTKEYRVSIDHRLESILERLQTNIDISPFQLHKAYYPQLVSRVDNLLKANDCTLGIFADGKYDIYATEDPDKALIEFSLTYDCHSTAYANGELIADGECTYLPKSSQLNDFRSRGETLHLTDSGGELVRRNQIVGVGSAIFGHHTVVHQVKTPLTPLITLSEW